MCEGVKFSRVDVSAIGGVTIKIGLYPAKEWKLSLSLDLGKEIELTIDSLQRWHIDVQQSTHRKHLKHPQRCSIFLIVLHLHLQCVAISCMGSIASDDPMRSRNTWRMDHRTSI